MPSKESQSDEFQRSAVSAGDPVNLRTSSSLVRASRRRFSSMLGFRWRNVLPIVFIVIVVAALQHLEEDRVSQANRRVVAEQLAQFRAELEKTLATRLYLVRGLAAFARQFPDMTGEAFSAYVTAMLGTDPDIRSIQWAPRAVVTHVFPLETNQKAIGHNLLADVARRPVVEESIRTGHDIISGPVNLLQGGVAIIARKPVYAESASDTALGEFLGFAVMVIDLERIYRESRLEDFQRTLHVAIRGRDGRGAQGEVFMGDSGLFNQPDSQVSEVTLPYGSWQVAAQWRGSSRQVRDWILWPTLFGGLGMGVVLYLNWRSRRDELRQAAAMAIVRDREERLSSTIENSPIGMALITPDGRWLQVNRALCAIVGYAPEDLLHRSTATLLHLDDLQAEQQGMELLRQGALSVYQTEQRYLNRTGHAAWVLFSASLLRDDSGQPRFFIAQIQDIHARKEAEQQARELLAFNRAILQEAPTGVAVYAAEGACIMANESLAQMVGATVDQLFAQDFRQIQSWRDSGLLEAADQALQSTETTRRNIQVLTSFGKQVALACSFSPLCFSDKPHLVLQVSDITAFLRTQEELTAAKEAADAASQAKSQFLANMSHEIRTPMNAILGLTQVLLDEGLQADQQAQLQKVHRSARALLNVLNGILDLSKVEAGRMDIQQAPFDLAQLLEQCQQLFSAQADKQGLEFTLDMDPDIPHWLIGDALRLGQVLNNLVGNAIKFTERGSVLGEVRCLERDAERILLEFSVQDTGIGIASGQQEAVFHAFSQADASVTRRFGGSGLGLSISQHLVKLMGGVLTLESTLGIGSRFHFTLRLEMLPKQMTVERIDEATTSCREVLRHLSGARILLVEDHELHQDVIESLLSRCGVQVDIAQHGRQALEFLASRTYDAVLMDLQLPEADGFATVRRIRAQPGFAELPVIAMTAAVLPQDREATLAAGMNAHVVKPVDPVELAKVLAALIQKRAPEVPECSPAPLEEPVIGLPGALELAGEDRALYRRGLKDFLGRLEDTIATVRDAARAKDARRLHDCLHRLKGEAGNLGLEALHQHIAALLETMAQPAQDDDLDGRVAAWCVLLRRAGVAALETISVADAAGLAADARELPPVLSEESRLQLGELESLLLRNNLRAAQLGAELLPVWAGTSQESAFRALLGLMDQMQYRQALVSLRTLMEADAEGRERPSHSVLA